MDTLTQSEPFITFVPRSVIPNLARSKRLKVKYPAPAYLYLAFEHHQIKTDDLETIRAHNQHLLYHKERSGYLMDIRDKYLIGASPISLVLADKERNPSFDPE